MTKLIRLAAGVLCLGALALGVVAFDPACLPTSSPSGDPDKKPSLAEGVAQRERLNQQQGAIHRRDEAKRRLTAEVLARRRSLAEAVEQYRILNQEWPPIPRPEPIILWRLGLSEEEWDAREVLRFVEQVLADRPDDAAAVAARLEKELQELLAERKKHRPAPAEPRTEERSR